VLLALLGNCRRPSLRSSSGIWRTALLAARSMPISGVFRRTISDYWRPTSEGRKPKMTAASHSMSRSF